ncbi:hypothetical protein Q5O24_02975 [Eubacteriaceae bacterium ES3]|nr:hypothetical protein Q5O24_02975 [Eubacteriaceae bacterium ES3]
MNNEPRVKNSIRNIYAGLIFQIISLLMNFLARTVFIKVLGVDYLGVNGLLTNIFTILTFTELVFGVALSYSMYRPIVDNNIEKIGGIFNYYKTLYKKAVIIIGIVGVCIIPLLPYMINSNIATKEIILYYIIFLINIVIYNYFIINTYLMIADQRRYIISMVRIVVDVVCFTVLIVAIILFENYLLYLLLITIKTLIFSVIIHILLKKHYPFVKENFYVTEVDKKRAIMNIKDLFIYRFSMVMLNGTDNILISVFVSTNMVGVYSNYIMVIMGLDALVEVIYSAVSASIGNLAAEKNNESLAEMFRMVQVVSIWLSGTISVCLLILFNDFIIVWIGADYLCAGGTVIIIIVNFYLACVRDSMKMFIEALGLFSKVKYMTLATAVLNIVFSVFLGYNFGITGILAATAISAILTFYWYEAGIIYKAMNSKKNWEYFLLQIISIVLIIANFIITNNVLKLFEFNGVTGFVIKMVLCFVICNSIYFAILFRTKAVKYLVKIIFKTFKCS